MQIFTNGKRRFHSFVELYVICSKHQGVKFWSWYHFNLYTFVEHLHKFGKWTSLRKSRGHAHDVPPTKSSGTNKIIIMKKQIKLKFYLTISISPNRTNWTTAKLKTRKFALFRNYMHITAINAHQKIKEQINPFDSQWRMTEERKDKRKLV